jgi:hypothetical protein
VRVSPTASTQPYRGGDRELTRPFPCLPGCLGPLQASQSEVTSFGQLSSPGVPPPSDLTERANLTSNLTPPCFNWRLPFHHVLRLSLAVHRVSLPFASQPDLATPLASPHRPPHPAYHPGARLPPSRCGRGRAAVVRRLAARALVAGSAQVSSSHSVTTFRSGVDHRSSPALLAALAESLPSRTPASSSPVDCRHEEVAPSHLRPPNRCPEPRIRTEVSVSPLGTR